MHRGFTHGLAGGALLLPPVLAGVLWLLDRWQAKYGRIAADALPMHFGWLLALCWIGAITHPLLDLQNTYAVQLLSPLSERWFHTDGLFIISPWLLAFLGLSIWRARAGAVGRPAAVALLTCAAFIAVNVGISALAWRAPSQDVPYEQPDRIFAAPDPLLFWQRDVVWRSNGTISHGHFDPFASLTRVSGLSQGHADNMDAPIVLRAAQASWKVRDFLAWSQMPFAKVDRNGCAVIVTFGDARFSGPALASNFTAAVRLTDC